MMLEPDASHEAEDNEARPEAIISSKDDNESLYGELQKVIHDLDSITKDVAAIKDKKAGKRIAPCTEDYATASSDDVMNDLMDKLNPPFDKGDDTMLGSNDVIMNGVMDKLTNQQPGRPIIAIAGMGGIGKTTLAKRIYENQYIVEYFDIRGWTIVSQEFDSKRILLQALDCLKSKGSEDSYEELGQKLYQSLCGRRYLIVMDDIWGTDAWVRVKRFFPDDNNGSRVLITTRLSNVASQLVGQEYFQMPFLEMNESWNLLRRFVFHEQGCPPELEEIGKDIAWNCGGLPLSIVVIGGLLAKSEQTQEKWKQVAENLSSIVNLEDDEHCFRILKMSYNQLPVHLKTCFLYMGMFSEDDRIDATTLISLWVDEGFVKSVAGRSPETVARVVYLHELVLRNLILVHRWGPTQRIECCGIHDLLRDLCIREAEKYKFFHTMETMRIPDDDQSWHAQRRIYIHPAGKYTRRQLPEAVQSASRARTLIWNIEGILPSVVPLRLLRILNADKKFSMFNKTAKLRFEEHFHPVNLRHLVITAKVPKLELPPEFYLLWNLRTIIVRCPCGGNTWPLVLDIWRMPQLRHVNVEKLRLTDPPPMEEENGWMVLEKLERLEYVRNLRLGEEVVERIPNIKKLGIVYSNKKMKLESSSGLDNLYKLCKLERLSIGSSHNRGIEVTSFPITLRKLSLTGTRLGWEEMGTKIGSLPFLEVLNIEDHAFVGPEWEISEGGFQSLKYLKIVQCSDLEQWTAEATPFPCLEQLDLEFLNKLNEIPKEIGDITTLRKISLDFCSHSAVLSAKKILEEQEECLGETNLIIAVYNKAEKKKKLTLTRRWRPLK